MKAVKVLFAVLVGFAVAGCSGAGGGSPNNDVNNRGKVTLSGTVATGLPMVDAQITIKGKNGITITTTTDANGKYADADVTVLAAPYLLKVLNPAGNGYIYSVATASGTANIHPFTDLIIRNWYKVKGSDVETEFSGTLIAANLPSVDGINTIASVVSSILGASMTSAGVPANFNLLTTPFDANKAGFDKVLDETKVVIDAAGAVTVVAIDPITGGTSTLVNTTVTTVSTPTADSTPPTDPSGLVGLPSSTSSIVLFWNAATDTVGVAGYNVYSVTNNVASKIASTPYPGYSHTGLTSAQYCYQVEAYDAKGNLSAKTAAACATPIADTTAPAAPTSLAATAFSASQINLTWVAPADTDVVGYVVSRTDSTGIAKDVATAKGISYSDTGLASSTAYSYTVKAKDAAGNLSVVSASASATTLVGIPTAPTGVTAAAASGQATISWNSVNGAVSYTLYMATQAGVTKSNKLPGAMTHLSVTSPYVHTGLANGTTYYFVVTAVNTSGESVESAQVSAIPMAATAAPPLPNPIVGSWSMTMATGHRVLITFFANGDYVHAEDGLADATGQTGMERGTYTWDVGPARLSALARWWIPMANGACPPQPLQLALAPVQL